MNKGQKITFVVIMCLFAVALIGSLSYLSQDQTAYEQAKTSYCEDRGYDYMEYDFHLENYYCFDFHTDEEPKFPFQVNFRNFEVYYELNK